MIADSRKTVRKELAALLSNDLVGSGKLAQAVYAYRVGDFEGQSPVVVVSSGGTLRQPWTMQGTMPVYHLEVDIFVLYANEAGTWTEENAEDRLDDIEQAIAEVIEKHQVNQCWDALTQTEMSERTDLEIGGVEYIHEMMVVEVQ